MFNAILEGTYFNDEGKYLKLLERKIPLGVTRIRDNRETLHLFGRTVDFQHILPHGETEEKEMSLQNRLSLSFGNGIILPPYRDDLELINLDNAKLLCMRDGRVFLTEHTRQEEKYMQDLKKILGRMQTTFNDSKKEIYFDHYTTLFK